MTGVKKLTQIDRSKKLCTDSWPQHEIWRQSHKLPPGTTRPPDATRAFRNVGKNGSRLFGGANLPTPAELCGGRYAAVYRESCPPSLPGGPSATEQLIKRLIISLSGSDSWTELLPMNDRGHAPLPAAESARTSTAPPAPPHRANLATGWKSPAASTAIAFWSSSYTAADFTSCARVRVQRRWPPQDLGVRTTGSKQHVCACFFLLDASILGEERRGVFCNFEYLYCMSQRQRLFIKKKLHFCLSVLYRYI